MYIVDIHAQKLKKTFVSHSKKKLKRGVTTTETCLFLSLSLDPENHRSLSHSHTYLTVLSPRFCYTWISNGSPQIRKSSSPQTHFHFSDTHNLKIQTRRIVWRKDRILSMTSIHSVYLYTIFLQFFFSSHQFKKVEILGLR